jgi:hypothetical protein
LKPSCIDVVAASNASGAALMTATAGALQSEAFTAQANTGDHGRRNLSRI